MLVLALARLGVLSLAVLQYILRYPSAGASSLSELTCMHCRKVERFNIGDNTEAVSEDPERYRSGDNDEYTIVRSRERRGGQNKATKA